jgi:hypothetical protein
MKNTKSNESKKISIELFVKFGKKKIAIGGTIIIGISTVVLLAIPQLINMLGS